MDVLLDEDLVSTGTDHRARATTAGEPQRPLGRRSRTRRNAQGPSSDQRPSTPAVVPV